MILVFIVLGLVILIFVSMFVFKLSIVKLEIKKLHILNEKDKLNVEFLLNIGIYFANKIKLVKFTIDNYKIQNLLQSGKIDFNKFKPKEDINKEVLKSIKYHNFKIEYLKLEGYFSTFDSVLSVWIYTLVQAIIPILISRKISGQYINGINFFNGNENKININLGCIISVKMVNIINILHYFKKERWK